MKDIANSISQLFGESVFRSFAVTQSLLCLSTNTASRAPQGEQGINGYNENEHASFNITANN